MSDTLTLNKLEKSSRWKPLRDEYGQQLEQGT